MTNLDFFAYSSEHPEPTLDPFYGKSAMVIPPTVAESNLLTIKNTRLLELISAFHVLDSHGAKPDDPNLLAVVREVREILDGTPHINFSAFTQFFLVYNVAYSTYRHLDNPRKELFLRDMLRHYCEERHPIYLSHGYTNTILQVMSDNYSHKRNSKASIDKIQVLMEPYRFQKLVAPPFPESGRVLFLPDKGDSNLFSAFRDCFSVLMRSAETEQGKLPDMVFGIDGEWFVVEMKNIKGSGGGQDKQLTEIINFIRYSEKNRHIHYLVFLDGDYSNRLFANQTPKIRRQHADILECMTYNPQNYFVNTAGFSKLLSEMLGS